MAAKQVDHYIEDDTREVEVDADIEGRRGTLDFDSLKSGGVIKQRQRDQFTVRLRCPGGRVPLDKLKKIVEVAERYGGDYVHLSVRQSIEIPYVDFRQLGEIQQELREVGQEIASCGPRVRVPTACSGCEYNPNGLTDTQKMARLVDEQFFGTELAHKFKISFSGCPIDCARSSEMDLGFQGAVRPEWSQETCIGCEICAKACKEGAIEADPATGEPIYYPEKCLYCGDCIRACPTESWEAAEIAWLARCGGKHGRHPTVGQVIAEFVSDEDVPAVIQAVLDWYREHGKDKGRTRIGTILLDPAEWESFVDHLKQALGDKAAARPLPPTPVDIHFAHR
ncbi:MAG: 4Fe-4S binding protein [Armatimonadota bacterium]